MSPASGDLKSHEDGWLWFIIVSIQLMSPASGDLEEIKERQEKLDKVRGFPFN